MKNLIKQLLTPKNIIMGLLAIGSFVVAASILYANTATSIESLKKKVEENTNEIHMIEKLLYDGISDIKESVASQNENIATQGNDIKWIKENLRDGRFYAKRGIR